MARFLMLATVLAAPLVTAAAIADAQSCLLCWEMAQDVATDPACPGLLATQDIADCLCKPANMETFLICSRSCTNSPDLLPKSVCDDSMTETAASITMPLPLPLPLPHASASSSGDDSANKRSAQINALKSDSVEVLSPSAHAKRSAKHKNPHNGGGGWIGPCGIPGQNCGFDNTSTSGQNITPRTAARPIRSLTPPSDPAFQSAADHGHDVGAAEGKRQGIRGRIASAGSAVSALSAAPPNHDILSGATTSAYVDHGKTDSRTFVSSSYAPVTALMAKISSGYIARTTTAANAVSAT